MKPLYSNILLRAMRRTNMSAVLKMMHALSGIKKLRAPFQEQYCFGVHKSFRCWVALAQGNLRGVATTSDWANLNLRHIDCTQDFLFVDRKWREQGMGWKLIACAVQDAVKSGCVGFQTSTGPANIQIHSFYESLGFIKQNYSPVLYYIKGKALRKLAGENL